MGTKSDENLEKYKNTFVKRNLNGCILIPAATPIEEVVRILCGPPDLTGTEIEEKPTKLDTALALKDPNPYVRARAIILKKMTDGDRKLIEKQEVEGKTDTNFYQAFVKKVSLLGDKLSAEKS
jgi:hypothetical protein